MGNLWQDQDASDGNRIGPNSTIREYWGPLRNELEVQSEYASIFFFSMLYNLREDLFYLGLMICNLIVFSNQNCLS